MNTVGLHVQPACYTCLQYAKLYVRGSPLFLSAGVQATAAILHSAPLICLVCPFSVSSFCIGQTQLRCLKLTTFFYCRPTPYLAQVETGLHKRMRWNVVRLANEHCKENSVGNVE